MRIPKYRRHSTGVGFYEYRGKRYYLRGAYDSMESKAAYRAFIRTLMGDPTGGAPMKPPTIAQLVLAWAKHCESYYGGEGEYFNCVAAAQHLADFARLPPAEFGPLKLKAIQKKLAADKRLRKSINAITGRIKRMFNWAVSEELVDASVAHGLAAVGGLRANRTSATESAPKQPVAWEHVLATIPHLNPTVRLMVLMQWHTGVRSKSLCLATPEQFKTDVEPWEWRPQHKTEHLGAKLVVFIGPQLRKLLAAHLQAAKPGQYLFRPTAVKGNKRYGKFYRRASYAQSIERGIDRANRQREIANELLPANRQQPLIPHWTPHQLRHAKGTKVRADHGLEAAQAVLGHGSIDATQIYAQRQIDTARKIAEAEG